ncbi:hypothetical protein EJB05_42950, partial [Eragrostis curvula]
MAKFPGYHIVGLEKDSELVTVSTLRVYGTRVAELPLVGTRFAHRKQGMCHLLMKEVEKDLHELGVERLMLPSVRGLLQTWTGSFVFKEMSESNKLEIAEHTILGFQEPLCARRSSTRRRIHQSRTSNRSAPGLARPRRIRRACSRELTLVKLA